MQQLSKTKKGVLTQLSTRKMRLKHKLFLVEGRKSVTELARYGSEKFRTEFLVTLPERYPEADKLARDIRRGEGESENDIPVYVAKPQEIREISTLATPPDIIAVCQLPERPSDNEITEAELLPDLYLLLDDVQDPGNLGTIIRTAHWMGIKRIFASYGTVDVFNPKVVQASMGSLGAVDVSYVDLKRLINAHPDIPTVGLMLEGEDIYTSGLPESAFIIMGNEGNGISEDIRKAITFPLTIPPYDPQSHAESLNVAIATAITLSEFRNHVPKA